MQQRNKLPPPRRDGQSATARAVVRPRVLPTVMSIYIANSCRALVSLYRYLWCLWWLICGHLSGVRYFSHIRRISLVDAGCGTKALTKATKRTVPFAFLFRSFFSFRLCLSFRCQALYLGPRGRNVGKPIGRASNNFADAVRAVPGAPHLSVAGGQLPLPACIRGHPR